MRKIIVTILAAGTACALAGCHSMSDAPATAASVKPASTSTQTAPDPQTGVVERTGPQEQTGVVERTGPQEQTGVVERTGPQEQTGVVERTPPTEQ
ncbi:hypothetical protein GGQ88_001305 [Novosphingobium hassiacum]|uniref:Argininosuccinate lyase n=1 Tax=Novosphingobium hassiacum TaxID=173676 RepID=A0A7W6EVU2_9SPHN|nr:hypothetical protein [Novosphingobium hassiacum]MBB3860044.1 hypothetical protein [Novosphingobium hassiacum]